jgi:hypothetical protein
MKNPLLLLLSVLTIGFPSIGTSQTERVLKQRLDSSISFISPFKYSSPKPYYKESYQYDQNGFPTEQIEYYWDTDDKKWVGDHKYLTKYDANKNLLSNEVYQWLTSKSKWNEELKQTYSYTSNHQVNSESLFNFGYTSKQWEKVAQTDSWYNQDSSIIKQVYSRWDESTYVLDGKIKYLYAYNNSKDLTQKETFRWNDTLFVWTLQSKLTNTYNPQGQKTKEESVAYLIDTSYWIGKYQNVLIYDSLGGLLEVTENASLNQLNVWYQNKKTQYVNDANNNHLEIIKSEYDTMLNVWHPISKIESLFNTDNLEISKIYYTWSNNAWIGQYWFEYSFDSLYQQTSISKWQFDQQLLNWEGKYKMKKSYYAKNINDTTWRYEWDKSNQAWLNTSTEYITLDNFNNPIRKKWMQLDTTALVWVNSGVVYSSFNTSYPKVDLIVPFSYQNLFQLNYSYYDNWDSVTNTWNTESELIDYFSTYNLTSVIEIPENDVMIYPNPTINILYFKNSTSNITQIQIFDLQGKLVLKKQLNNQNSVSLSDLPSGVYIYQITNIESVISGKFTKL